jgi:tetratricopeptide (TPR) repeat protein
MIAGCTAVVDLAGVPAELLLSALLIRGGVHAILDQHKEALEDYCRLLGIAELPKNYQVYAYLNRGKSYEEVGNTEEALADYGRCAQSGVMPFVHYGLQSTARLLLSEKRVDEALAWVRRFHELEPRDASLDTRLEARLDMIRAASRVGSLDDASRLADTLLEADPEELRARLQFLKPGLELAKTHDESVLAKLPEDERKIAKEIARSLAEAARPPMGQPPS